jgi:hypothetical protein
MIRSFLILCFAYTLCSCGSFERDWQNAIASPAPATGIEGAWTGTWRSDSNGHQGQLRCLVARRESGYDFVYHAKWGRLFRGTFSNQPVVEQRGQSYHLNAEKTLGRRGLFQASGILTPSAFSARYQAAGDHGQIRLGRPQ